MIRLNIELNESVVAEAIRLSGLKSKKEVVNAALKLHVASLKRAKVLTK